MQNNYLLVLEGGNMLREVELSRDSRVVRVGTTQHCEVRFRKDLFFSPFELELNCDELGQWAIVCSDEVYFSIDGVRKLAFVRLSHGAEFAVRYAKNDTILFVLRFTIDFGTDQSSYDRMIDLSGMQGLSIGGKPNCNLALKSTYTVDDMIQIRRIGGAFYLSESASKYGTYYNGKRLTGEVELRDMSFIAIANYSFYYKDSKLFLSRTDDIGFNGVSYVDERAQNKASEYPRFNRNTRIMEAMDAEGIPVLDPPPKQEKPRSNIVVQLLPAVGMLAITLLLRGQLMNTTGQMGFILISACSIGIGILASVIGIVSERMRYRKESRERVEKYTAYIAKKREEVEGLRNEELQTLAGRYPSVRTELEMVHEFSSDLFDRREEDEDFLHAVLGSGPRLSAKQLDYKQKEALDIDDLADLPQSLFEEFKYLDNAPVVADLAQTSALGIVGPPSKSYAVMKNLVIDLASRHYANDLKLFFFVEESNEPLIHWARYLPHVQNEDLGRRNVVCDEESRSQIFEYLYKELIVREGSKGERTMPRIALFFIDECGFKNHPISQFVDKASELGVCFVFFERMKEFLPQGCDMVAMLDRKENAGALVSVLNARETNEFTYETVEDDEAEAVANKLAPVYSEEVSLEGALTKNITLFEMLGIIAADDLDLASRWASTAVHKSLSAPLGVTKNKTVYLDLHDKAHGPHGLVAGTTGSGKSEILQTYILSMATLFHPYEVSFLIIDFKGGGMVNQFRSLPHLVGAITNIDGREIERSLKSIKAELQKRQRLFANADVNHISNYIKKYKAHDVEVPLPHLIIIVDEFAELKAEQPEFMKELISASRIGRSLGVHLILATQKPAGQVSEQIWSNSRFKLCLKVQSREDSNEVLKSPLAADIKEPGRAYLQVGNNEVFELFQSAYSGAPEHIDDDNVKEYTIFEVSNSGKRTPVFMRKRQRSEAVSATQLDAVVEHVAAYCVHSAIEKLPSICLPPLEERIVFPDRYELVGGRFPLGIYDDPDSQYQGPALFDLDSSNVFIVGSSQTGKTNLLQDAIRGIAQARTSAQASIYILDFASMILKNFEELNHVGGVVLASEDEKLKNLFKLLGEELAVRKRKLLEVGVSSFGAYEEAGYTDLPHIYLIIDNFAVFRELYADAHEDQLLAICRDGLAYGVTLIVANNATSGFGFKYMSNFSTYIALSCNDSSEYSVVFDRCRMEPKNTPGRALCSIDKAIYEFQAYLAFEGEREVDRVRAMRSFVERCNSANAKVRAKRIPSVPDELPYAYIRENYEMGLNELAIALSYETVEPVRIDLDTQFSFAISGKNDDCRRAMIDAILMDVRENIFDRPVDLFIIDNLTRDLQPYKDLPYVRDYLTDAAEISLVFDAIMPELERRYRLVAEEGLDVLADEPYLIILVNSADALTNISTTGDLLNQYEEAAKQYASMRVLFVFSDVSDSTISYSSPALLKSLKESKRAFVASNMNEIKLFDITSTYTRMYRAPLDEYQAYWFNDNDVMKVKVASSA